MAKKLVNIETGYEKAGFVNVEAAAGVTIDTGMWFSLDASGNGIVATNAHRLVFLCMAGEERPDVNDDAVSLPTGSLTGAYGKLIVSVDVNGYDVGGTYALDTPLKIVNGKLVNGVDGTDIIVARALGALSGGILRFVCDAPVVVAAI